MTRRKVPVSEWRECPHCRYPMVRWAKFTQTPERVWVNWHPDEWVLPVHFLILGGLMLLALTFPWLGEVMFGGHHRRGWGFQMLESMGVGVAVLVGYGVYLYRRQKREKLALNMRARDWVCAKCLHVKRERPA